MFGKLMMVWGVRTMFAIIGIIIIISVIAAIMQTRNRTQRIEEKLDDIYRLLKDQNNP